MTNGTVKWFNGTKGFGLIAPLDGGEDVFVHFSAIVVEGVRTLSEGQQVEFERVTSDKGPFARAVRPVG